MPTVVISPYGAATFPEGGGRFSVYLQYVLGLRQAGCEVYWLEGFRTKGQRQARRGAKHRAQLLPSQWRRNVSFFDPQGSGPGLRGLRKTLPRRAQDRRDLL